MCWQGGDALQATTAPTCTYTPDTAVRPDAARVSGALLADWRGWWMGIRVDRRRGRVASSAAGDPVSGAALDAPELFDVDVHERAGPAALVAFGGLGLFEARSFIR